MKKDNNEGSIRKRSKMELSIKVQSENNQNPNDKPRQNKSGEVLSKK